MTPTLRETLTAEATLAAVRSAVLPGLPPQRIQWADDLPTGRDGEYDRPTRTIRLRPGLPVDRIQGVTVHEAAHAAMAELRAIREGFATLTGRSREPHRGAEEAIARRFETLEPEAVAEVRRILAEHRPSAVKAASPGWVEAQRAKATDYACEMVTMAEAGTVELSPAARAKHAATCGVHGPQSRDSATAALSARMAGWDAAHAIRDVVGSPARGTVTSTAWDLLQQRRRHVRTAAKDLGLTPEALRAWSARCQYEQMLG